MAMSSSNALKELEQALLATVHELEDQRNAARELVTTEMLLAVAGRSAAEAYEKQLAAVHEAAEAHRQATAAVKAQKEAAAKMQAAQQAAITVLGNAGRAAESWARMASPTAWSTMTDSFKLVGMQLGMFFIPAIAKAAVWAQKLADWLEHLSPDKKALMTQGATYAAGAYAFNKAASAMGLGGTMGVARGAMGLAKWGGGISIGGTGGAAPASGLAALITPITLVASGVLVAGLAFKASLDKSAEAMEKFQTEVNKAPWEKFSPDELRQSDMYKKYAAIADPEERRKAIDKESIKASDEVGASKRALEEFSGPMGMGESIHGFSKTLLGPGQVPGQDAGYLRGSALMLPGLDLIGNMGANQIAGQEAARQRYEAAVKRSEMVAAMGNELNNKIEFNGSTVGDKEGRRGTAESGKKGGSGFLAHEFKVTQATYSPIEEARRAIQTRTLNTDTLEQKMQQLMIQAAQKFIDETSGQIKDTARNTKGGAALS